VLRNKCEQLIICVIYREFIISQYPQKNDENKIASFQFAKKSVEMK